MYNCIFSFRLYHSFHLGLALWNNVGRTSYFTEDNSLGAIIKVYFHVHRSRAFQSVKIISISNYFSSVLNRIIFSVGMFFARVISDTLHPKNNTVGNFVWTNNNLVRDFVWTNNNLVRDFVWTNNNLVRDFVWTKYRRLTTVNPT